MTSKCLKSQYGWFIVSNEYIVGVGGVELFNLKLSLSKRFVPVPSLVSKYVKEITISIFSFKWFKFITELFWPTHKIDKKLKVLITFFLRSFVQVPSDRNNSNFWYLELLTSLRYKSLYYSKTNRKWTFTFVIRNPVQVRRKETTIYNKTITITNNKLYAIEKIIE